MKKILILLFITIMFVFALCNQSVLIDRDVSSIPFTPNIFVNASNAKKVSILYDAHSEQYLRKLNDSLNIYYEIYETSPYNDRVTGIIWEIKYKNMTSENLLSYLESNNLSLVTHLREEENLFDENRRMFWNHHINQYLRGSYDKLDNSFYISYSYPNTYYDYYKEDPNVKEGLKEPEKKISLKKVIKDFFIGAPH